VQLSRDSGATWNDVTPEAVRQMGRGGESTGEALINSIEASPHDAGTAYIAVSRYKFNDLTPHFFRTTDSGETWTHIVDGIADEHWARVIREDPERSGLLYAGTENGMYVSFDAGDQWHSWQLNLPTVPVTDLFVHPTGDLIASTQGRAFWILDDLTPLRQLTAGDMDAPTLLQPRDTVMVTWSGGFGPGPGPGGGSFPGQNPPPGVQIFFHMPESEAVESESEDVDADADSDEPVVTLRVLDAAGGQVRVLSTDPDSIADAESLSVSPGLNRVAWDFRHSSVEEVEDIAVFGSFGGREVTPGEYVIELTVGEETLSQRVTLKAAPWRTATVADYQAQDEFVAEVHDLLGSMSGAVNRLYGVRTQIEALAKRAADVDGTDDLREACDDLSASLEAWDAEIIARQTHNFQDIINFENKLLAQVIALVGAVDGTEPPVTAGVRERLVDLQAAWAEHADRVSEFETEIESINAMVRDAGMGGIVLPSSEE